MDIPKENNVTYNRIVWNILYNMHASSSVGCALYNGRRDIAICTCISYLSDFLYVHGANLTKQI
jgi:hypothetical protein